MSKPKIEVWTDGGLSRTNPGPGGWGAVLSDGRATKAIYGAFPFATNNFMETYAVLQALTALKKPCAVMLYADSSYVLIGLRALAWGKVLKTNTELWQQIKPLVRKHSIQTAHVPGHATCLNNELADALAGWGAKKRLEGGFFLDEVGVGTAEERLLQTVQKRVERRKAAAGAGTGAAAAYRA